MCSESNHLSQKRLLFIVDIRNPKDFEDLYSILSNESPSPMHADSFKSIPPKGKFS